MNVFPKGSQETDFIRGALQWLDFLKQGRVDNYQAAWDYLYHPPDERWNLKLMKDSIETYGAPYDKEEDLQRFYVTDVDDEVPLSYLEHDSGPELATIEIDLPLNGEISQLTAQLIVVPVRNGFGLLLYDIHVL